MGIGIGTGKGGARSGAGRKKKQTIAAQQNRRDVLLEVLNSEEWSEVAKEWVATARATKNFTILFPMLPYLMGAAKQEIEHSGEVNVTSISDIRKAIGVESSE
jgi:hypothetical protein